MSARIPTVTQPIPGYLTREEAAKRVGRSVRTIRSWQADGLCTVLGRIPEADLLAWDRRMRERTGRPRKARPTPEDTARAIVDALGGQWLVLLKRRGEGDPPPLGYDDMAEEAQAFWRAVAAAGPKPGGSET